MALDSAELPARADGQVLIQVEAAGVNYSDVLRRKSEFFLPTPLPDAQGTDAAG